MHAMRAGLCERARCSWIAQQRFGIDEVRRRDDKVAAAAIPRESGLHAHRRSVEPDVETPHDTCTARAVLQPVLDEVVALLCFEILAGEVHAVEVAWPHAAAGRDRDVDRLFERRQRGLELWSAGFATDGKECAEVGSISDPRVA